MPGNTGSFSRRRTFKHRGVSAFVADSERGGNLWLSANRRRGFRRVKNLPPPVDWLEQLAEQVDRFGILQVLSYALRSRGESGSVLFFDAAIDLDSVI